MDQNTLHTVVSLWICVCCCCEGRTFCWPSHRGSRVVPQGAPSVPPFPWFSIKAVSDFWIWFVTTSFRLQLLLFYFALQDLLLLSIHHYIMFYLYSRKLNTMLLFFLNRIQISWELSRCMETSWSPGDGSSELGEGTTDNSTLPSRRSIDICIDGVKLHHNLFKDEWCWELEECLEDRN